MIFTTVDTQLSVYVYTYHDVAHNQICIAFQAVATRELNSEKQQANVDRAQEKKSIGK